MQIIVGGFKDVRRNFAKTRDAIAGNYNPRPKRKATKNQLFSLARGQAGKRADNLLRKF